VHPIVNTSVDDLGDIVGELAEAPGNAGRGRASQSEARRVTGENSFQHTGCGGLKGAVGAGILGVHRRPDKRFPTWIAFGRVIAVRVAVTDRRYRAPEVILVLCFEDRDARVGRRDRKQREEASIVDYIETFRRRKLARDVSRVLPFGMRPYVAQEGDAFDARLLLVLASLVFTRR